MVVVVEVAADGQAAVDSLAGIISVGVLFAGDTCTCTRSGWKPDAGVASTAAMVRVPMTTAAAAVRVVAGDVPMIHVHVHARRLREVTIIDACDSLTNITMQYQSRALRKMGRTAEI